MWDILNDFYESNPNKEKNKKILKNCKGFISYKFISPYFDLFKLRINNSNKFKLLKSNDCIIKSERKYKIFDSIKNKENLNKSYNKNKLILSTNKTYEKKYKNNIRFTSRNIEQIKFKNKLINKSLNLNENINNYTKLDTIINNNIFHPHSTKNIISKHSINERMIENRVNNIINNLLYGNKEKINNKKVNHILFPLNKSINPKKYIEINLINEPNNNELFQSFNEQIKRLGNIKLRHYLIDGINNYSKNVKNYSKIHQDVFYKYNYDNKSFKKAIRNIIIGNKIKNDFSFGNKKYEVKKTKKSCSLYNIGLDKFKKNYDDIYKNKKYNFTKKKQYFKRNGYFQSFNNHSFNKICSVDEKIKKIFSSVKETYQILGKNTSSIILGKNMSKI